MADWKDFFEDGKEFHGQFLDAVEQRQSRTRGQVSPPPAIGFCPLCDKPFIEEHALLDHIRRVHGPQHVYLRLNGSVIRDVGWAADGVFELSVVPIGFSEISVELHAKALNHSLSVTSDTGLDAYVPMGFEGQLNIDVAVPAGGKREFLVYVRSLPEFRHDTLDSSIVTLASEALAGADMPGIQTWRRHHETLNELEARYLNGFYEYALAFHLEKYGRRTTAKGHFDESLGYLLPFRTPLAKSAQCVLGLRMNCFGVLRHAARTSVLALCDKFFNDSAAEPKLRRKTTDLNPFITYADEFTVLLVNSIADYCDGNYSDCQTHLHALEFHPSAVEKNNEDKLLLLSARLHDSLGDDATAFDAYRKLQFHPDFGREAKEFMSERA